MSICPHCKKKIHRGMTAEIGKRARVLKSQGYSLREMEKVLWAEGLTVSPPTLSRFFRKAGGQA